MDRKSDAGRPPPGPKRGFTLIELIVVLMIIAATAGLVIPAVAMLSRSTDMAATAHTQAALANNLQEFFVLQKRYPQGLDSLLQDLSGGTLGSTGDGTPDGIYVPQFDSATPPNQTSGMTASSPNLVGALEMGTLSANQVRSLTRSGFDWVFDHQTYDWATNRGEPNANNSGKFRRALTSAATQSWALLRIPAGDSTPADQSAMTIIQRIVPAEVSGDAIGTRVYTPEAGTRLVAFGVGPSSRLFPTTALNCPSYPGADGKYYARFIAIFKCFESAERAVLVAVTDAYGRTPDYSQQQFAESLPNGGRQG